MPQELEARPLCQALLAALGVSKCDYTCGVTQVWFRAGRLAFVDELLRTPADDIAVRVNSWLARRRFKNAVLGVRGANLVIATWCSGILKARGGVGDLAFELCLTFPSITFEAKVRNSTVHAL